MNGEEFLQSKDIWHHPRVSTRKSDVSYDIAELLDEFLEAHTKQNSHKHGVSGKRPNCPKCGMPSHPVLGYKCASDECAGKAACATAKRGSAED